MRERNIIIIMLIIIIILLLAFLLVNHLGTIEVKAPTGNVDIYDITIIDKEDNDDNVIVYDEKGQKINTAPLKIFEHKSYHVKNDVIAPGTENSYQFVIRNNNEFAIIYDFEIIETNEFDINMKFRLKQNDKYIFGNEDKWFTVDELKQNEVILANNSYNVYTLDWKWFESENDTKIGEEINSKYELDLSFNSNRY